MKSTKVFLVIAAGVTCFLFLAAAIIILAVFLVKASNSENVYYGATFRILDDSYNQNLASHKSKEFSQLSQETIKLLNTVYTNSNLSSNFISAKVVEFKPGSIIVRNVVEFNTKGSSSITKASVDNTFHQSLQKSSIDNEIAFLGRFKIDLNSIQFTELTEADVLDLFPQATKTTTSSPHPTFDIMVNSTMQNNSANVPVINTTTPRNIITSSKSCGTQPEIISRIVGGTDSVQGEWPWQVSLQVRRSHVCGASIISDRWLLSAAHCFQGVWANQSQWTAYMGSTIIGKGTSRAIKRIVTHPNFGKTLQQFDYDVAVLELSSPLSFTNFIRPVCLPSTTHIFSDGQTCTVTGWGTLSYLGDLPTILQKANIKIIRNSLCRRLYKNSITNRMMCAGILEGGVDSCQGDSGGPLICQQSDGTWLQAGIVSFGKECALPNVTGVYSRVTSLRIWVLNETGV
ncbi:transmembrane protease serine 11C [Callorhinchus milii]|uniref:Enteropeptidase n=1 Tax=Callorhinchus milii TaxID=7868 RepID=V9KS35_CALMI|nr:transmembrane protease serine 11C [Callorhinchus milii]|eukprot:gi/632949463/ref/XP_007890170.1/ PREDICTED: transmembrane protease serine 11E [Callorhinchus milii]